MVDYTAILILFIFALSLGGIMVALSVFFGPKNKSRWKQKAYESGSNPLSDARIRFDVKYYLIAISFIMFDLEAVFLIPWAVVGRDYGPYAFWVAFVFIGILTAGLVYEWARGGLEWE